MNPEIKMENQLPMNESDEQKELVSENAKQTTQEDTSATKKESRWSKLKAQWWDNINRRIALIATIFTIACFGVFIGDLVLAERLPSPHPQPEEDSAELKRLKNLLLSSRNYKAKEGLLEYVAANPNNSDAHFALATVLRSLGQFTSSLRHVKISIALEPEDVNKRMFLATVYQEQGWVEHALEELNAALEVDPVNYHALTERMNVNFSLGRYDHVRNDVEFLVIAHPRSVDAHVIRANTLIAFGDFQGAIAAYTKILALGDEQQKKHAQQQIIGLKK